MRKAIIICTVVLMVVIASFCTKEPVDKDVFSLPENRVEFLWESEIGSDMTGIMIFVETKKAVPVTAVKSATEFGFTLTSVNGVKYEPTKGHPNLTQECKCQCGNTWSPNPNLNWDCCIACPVCGTGATNAYCYLCDDPGWGVCWFIWVD